ERRRRLHRAWRGRHGTAVDDRRSCERPRENAHSTGPAPAPQASRGVRARASDKIGGVIGSTIQHYRVRSRLGSGGMGEVYLAEDLRLGREVALKFLAPASQTDEERRARLLTEARAASALRSSNIAAIYDIGEHEGTLYLVMEYVEGEPLSERIARGPLP